MILQNYRFRNGLKERVCQIHDTFEHARRHPLAAMRKQAYESTVNFITENFPRALACRSPRELTDIALSRVAIDGSYLEFGVAQGASIRHIAKKAPFRNIHGFDCFEGIPEAWANNNAGAFTNRGRLPKVPANVELWKGYFEQTLPVWMESHPENVAYLHVDCDLYSSTKTIFDCLGKRIVSGTIIDFDDYFNFPGWDQDGHRAFMDYLKSSGHSVEYIGYGFKELAVRIL